MNDDELVESDEENDVIDLNQYTANRKSPVKRGKTQEEDGKLLTSRGNPVTDGN